MKKGSLQDKISRFLFSYRNTPQGTTGSTPAQLLMGRTPRSPFDLLRPDLSRRVNKEQEQQKFYYDQHSHNRSLDINQPVFIKNFGHGAKQTPWIQGTVKEIVGSQMYRICLTDGRLVTRHIDHVRTDYTPPAAEFSWDTSPMDLLPPVSVSPSDPLAPPAVSPTPPPAPMPLPLPTPPPLTHYPKRIRRPVDRYAPLVSH